MDIVINRRNPVIGVSRPCVVTFYGGGICQELGENQLTMKQESFNGFKTVFKIQY